MRDRGITIAAGSSHNARPPTRRGEKSMEFINRVRSFVRDEEGQDLLEYALLIALIALVCVGAVALAGTKVSTVFTNIASQIPAGT
jgi:pilus assembly protein Flp/PilA